MPLYHTIPYTYNNSSDSANRWLIDCSSGTPRFINHRNGTLGKRATVRLYINNYKNNIRAWLIDMNHYLASVEEARRKLKALEELLPTLPEESASQPASQPASCPVYPVTSTVTSTVTQGAVSYETL